MAIYKIFPSKDATLYTEDVSMNTGLDQILEASTYIKLGAGYLSRYLIQFSSIEMNDVLENKIGTSSFSSSLKNFAAVVDGLDLNATLYFYPVSGSWTMGTGHYQDSPIVANGVSWKYSAYSGSNEWPTSVFGNYATASFSSSEGGGTWYTGSFLERNVVHSQSFAYSDPIDINVNVTDTILTWYSESDGGLPNNGFIVKQAESQEFNITPNNAHTYKYFSIDTNTIYPPQLEFKWYDYTFDIGSSTNVVLSTPQSFISIYNNVGVYYSESIARLRIAAVPKYPIRTFQTASQWTTNFFLPESQSLYAIKDTETNEFVVDFDSSFTRISADATSSYFDVYMGGLEPERYYTVLIQTILDGTTVVFDEDIMFKVAKG